MVNQDLKIIVPGFAFSKTYSPIILVCPLPMHSMKLYNIAFIIHWKYTNAIFKGYNNSLFLSQNPFVILWPYFSELVLPFITFTWAGYFPASIFKNKQIKLLHTDSSGTYVLNWFLDFSDATLIVAIAVIRVGFQNYQIVVVVNTPNINIWLKVHCWNI